MEDQDGGDDEDDIDLKRAKRAQRERPLSFANMSEVRDRFESGAEQSKEERREERKQEIQNIRSRLFMGKQAKIKEMYQQAVLDSENSVRATAKKPELDIGDKAKSIKDRFERGLGFGKDSASDDGAEGVTDNQQKGPKQQDEDMAGVFELGLGKQSRSMFMEMDANSQQQQLQQIRQHNIGSPRTDEIKKLVRPSVSTNSGGFCSRFI